MDVDLCNIRRPFLIRTSCKEVSSQDVRSHLTNLSFIRVIVLFTSLGLQIHLPHELLDCLMIDDNSFVKQLGRDTTIAISAMICIIYSANAIPDDFMTIWLTNTLYVVIECRTSHLPEPQKEFETVFRP